MRDYVLQCDSRGFGVDFVKCTDIAGEALAILASATSNELKVYRMSLLEIKEMRELP